MAFSLRLLLLLSAAALLISPSHSATCAVKAFKSSKVYSNCTDLDSFESSLHWTYDASNSSLSIAFTAAPSKSDGWIAWAVNPTATKMAGAQTLLAYKSDDGTPAVKTFNISSYSSIVPGKLAFEVWDVSATFSNGTFTIFATVKVPEKAESVNQVWQVGPGVNKSSGFPEKHDFSGPNLKSFSTLALVGNATTTNTTTGATTTNTTTGATTTTTNSTTGATTTNTTTGGKSGAVRIEGNVGLFSGVLLVLGALLAF